MRSGCGLDAVWMRSGCGVNYLSLSQSVSDYYRMVINTQTYKCTDGRTADKSGAILSPMYN